MYAQHKIFLFFSTILILLCFFMVCPASAETLTQEKKAEEEFEKEKRDNLFNMIFGSAPAMPTERGILVIYAFHDKNGNKIKDPGEEDLRNEIVCRIDGIKYRVPAFIPALKLHEMYRLECGTNESLNNFIPDMEDREIFIQRRGQVFTVELPCRGRPEPSIESTTPSAIPVH